MSSKPIEGKYLLGARVEESFYMVQRALNELGLKKLKMKKEVRPSYLLVEYSPGWLEKTEIEFTLKGRQNATEISVKWFCPTSESEMRALTGDEGWLSLSRVDDENKRHQAERLLQELKSRIGATDIPPEEKVSRDMVKEKEIVREKEVIVKIRCRYCNKPYDEALDSCPYCGGHT